MPKYKVIGSFYYDMRLFNDGETVDYDGEPGDNLAPLDAAARKAKERAGKVAPPAPPLDAEERAELERLRAEKESRATTGA